MIRPPVWPPPAPLALRVPLGRGSELNGCRVAAALDERRVRRRGSIASAGMALAARAIVAAAFFPGLGTHLPITEVGLYSDDLNMQHARISVSLVEHPLVASVQGASRRHRSIAAGVLLVRFPDAIERPVFQSSPSIGVYLETPNNTLDNDLEMHAFFSKRVHTVHEGCQAVLHTPNCCSRARE